MSSAKSSSLFGLFTAGLACFASFASAYTQPVGAEPKGNPISQPGLASVVPVSKGFTITWKPTTEGTVTLVLLKGPSSNAVPQYAIAEKIENSGSYVWTPKKNLEPTEDATGYGIQLIDDETGQYQYTTQFGISNPDYEPSSSSSSSAPVPYAPRTSAAANATTSAATYYTTEVVSKFTTYCPYATSVTVANHTYTVSSATTLTITDCPCTITKPASATSTGTWVASTGWLPHNSSIVQPTGSLTVPSSLLTTAIPTLATSSSAGATSATSATASSSPPVQTGGAATMATSFAGLVMAAGIAVFAI